MLGDDDGRFLEARNGGLTKGMDSLTAEASACRQASEVLVDSGLQEVIIESDYKVLG